MQLDENFELGEKAVATCESHGMIDGMFSTEASDAADLIRVRKLAYPALERLGATLLDDVALPVTRIAEFVGLVEGLAAKHQLTIGIFGHAGDGNMHPTIVHDHGDEEGEKRAKMAFSEIVRIAQSLGGTASGEHGIGSIKRGLVMDEVSQSVIEIQRAIKKLLDPAGILNPGKKLP
jgi:glycolate oxidase